MSAARLGWICIAVLLYLYAGAGLLIGLVLIEWAGIGVPMVAGAVCVGVGTLKAAAPARYPSILLVVGGVLSGGMLGLLTAAWEYTEAGILALGFALGALFVGWPPVVVALGRVVWRSRGR